MTARRIAQTLIAATLATAGFAQAEAITPIQLDASGFGADALGGAAGMQARHLRGLASLFHGPGEVPQAHIDEAAHGALEVEHPVAERFGVSRDFSFDVGTLMAWDGSATLAGLPPLGLSDVQSAAPNAATPKAIVGLGMRVTNNRIVTLWVQRRPINADGSLGAAGLIEKFGMEPNSQVERWVELPAGRVATGISGRIDGDTLTRLAIRHRSFDRGYLGTAEASAGDAAPYELGFGVPVPAFLTQVGFRGNGDALLEAQYSKATAFFTPIAGLASGGFAQVQCPAGTEAVGTVQVPTVVNGQTRIGQFGLVCGAKAQVNAGQAFVDAQLTVAVGAYTDAAGRVFAAGNSALAAYKTAQVGEVVRTCAAGYTLDQLSLSSDPQGVRRINSLLCRERAVTAGPSTRSVDVAVGSVAGAVAVINATLDVPNAQSSEGLIIWAGPQTRGLGLHFLNR